MSDLSKYRGIIYLIRNSANGRCYVGQTLRSFYERYGRQWWGKKMHNKALKEDIEKYGKDKFEIVILEHSKTAEQLKTLEEDHAIKHDAYLPVGYNDQSCFKKFSSRCVLSQMDEIELNNPSGEDVVIKNPFNFCIVNQLSPKCIYLILQGVRFFHKGWTAKGNKNKYHPRTQNYVLYDEAGHKYEINNLSKFCKKMGLDNNRMRQMILRTTNSSQGYALSPNDLNNQKWQYIVTLINGDQEKIITNIRLQSKDIGLSPASVQKIVAGKTQSCKGWFLKSLDKMSLHEFRKERVALQKNMLPND